MHMSRRTASTLCVALAASAVTVVSFAPSAAAAWPVCEFKVIHTTPIYSDAVYPPPGPQVGTAKAGDYYEGYPGEDYPAANGITYYRGYDITTGADEGWVNRAELTKVGGISCYR